MRFVLVCLLSVTACKKAMKDYKNKAMASEAQVKLGSIRMGAMDYYESEHVSEGGLGLAAKSFPKERLGPTPDKSCDKKVPNNAVWEAWAPLKFHMDSPHYYSYEYVPSADGMSFEAFAYADLDCDGEYHTLQISGKIQDGKATISQPLEIKPD